MGVLTALSLVVAALFTLLYLFYKRSFRFWKNLGFPHTEPSFPFGDASGLIRRQTIADVVSEIYKKFPQEQYVGFWLLFRPNLLVRDPDLIKSVLVRDFMSFHDRGIHVNEKDDPLSGDY